jgi:glycerol-3-phosphate acyltransferase PlsY
MFQNEILPLYALAYLLGSVPTAVWVGKLFYGVDVREHGSKNAGATNTYRVLGRSAAIPVLLIDILKGFAATSLIHLYPDLVVRESSTFVLIKVLCGAMAVTGHLFPVFAGFRGGKGVATLFGMIIGLHPAAAGISLLAFALTYGISSYVSLGSMVASLGFVVAMLVFREDRTAMLVFAGLQFALIIITHRKNIKRILAGEEKAIRLSTRTKNI